MAISRVTRRYRVNKKQWRVLLAENGISQNELARRVEMNANSLSIKVRGLREFTVSELIALADELHTAPMNLIELMKEKEPGGGAQLNQ